jgi:hypothetical protein
MKSKNQFLAEAPKLTPLSTHSAANKTALPKKINTNLGKNYLRHAIQIALASSLLASGVASAILQDHGPSDPALTWPSWYRDTNGLALGLCKSASTMCFPLAPNPAGYQGNVGDEIFYSVVEFPPTATGSDFQFRYLSGLEASYLPAGKPVHGSEFVFARVRITFNFTDVKKNGTYKVTHPYGVETFENVQATAKTNVIGAKAANFFTVDIPLGPEMNFKDALTGAIGPFPQWDSDLPVGGLPGPIAGERFVGDPTIPHTFTGSPFGTNFLEIEGPVGSNLNGLGMETSHILHYDLANVMGQLWTAPIAQNLAIDQALMSRSNTTNSIDVWASTSPKQKVIMTGRGMPSLQMYPAGNVPGKYHGHVEYDSAEALPNTITVTNLSSIPVVGKTAAVRDMIEIAKATYNTNTREIIVVAQSSDEYTHPKLVVQGIPGVPSVDGTVPTVTAAMSQETCQALVPSVTSPHDVCFVHTLPANIEVPESVSVISETSGSHGDHLLSIVGNPQNLAQPPKASNYSFSVSSGGSTDLVDVDNNSLPLDALITEQPLNGTVELVAGIWKFTATTGASVGGDGFKYIRQDNDFKVSNVATGNLNLSFNATAPKAVADQFAATYAGTTAAQITAKTRTVAILGNDKPASTNPLDQINPATTSLTIVTEPTKGNLTKLASGQITYVTKTATAASGGADFFEYKVNNFSDPALTSNTVKVDITNFPTAEAVSVASAKYTIASRKWVVVGTTSWFGPNLANTTATCWVGTGAAPTASTLIGSVPVDSAGNYQLAVLGAAVPTGVNNGALRCKTSNGGLAAGITAAK